ncbi:MAG: YihY/virulence factor BrkB family protein [Akkermansiaceae bacterium]
MVGNIRDLAVTSGLRLKRCWSRWWKHEHADTAASLAFYSLISLVPILITGISVAAWLVDEETAKRSLLEGTSSIAGSSVANYFADLLGKNIRWFGSGFSPVLGALFLLYAATKVLAELRKCLGLIFGQSERKKKKRAMEKLMNRGVAVILLLFLGIFIASAVVVETMLGVLLSAVDSTPIVQWLTQVVAPLLTFVAMVFMAAIAMRWLPERPPTFKVALKGGVISALLLILLKRVLALVLNHANVGSFYGSALTLVLVLFWIYFAMQAFLFGAEYAAELMRERRLAIKSTDNEEI